MNMFQTIIGGLVVAALVGSVKFGAPWAKENWSQWRRRRASKVVTRKNARKLAERDRVRREKIAAADSEGRLIVVSRSGRCPVVDTFNDGSRSYYFDGDWDAYRAAMHSGHYDLRRTLITAPPPIVSATA